MALTSPCWTWVSAVQLVSSVAGSIGEYYHRPKRSPAPPVKERERERRWMQDRLEKCILKRIDGAKIHLYNEGDKGMFFAFQLLSRCTTLIEWLQCQKDSAHPSYIYAFGITLSKVPYSALQGIHFSSMCWTHDLLHSCKLQHQLQLAHKLELI